MSAKVLHANPTRSQYVIQGGEAEVQRLRLLARAKWPTTEALLRQAGLAPGMRCLDVGCGIGEVTRELARWVGLNGQVVGIDANEDFVALARAETTRRGLPAVFHVARAGQFQVDAPFDLVYARFLLTHLPEPLPVLGWMAQAARAGGVVVVEDIDFSGYVCYPDCPALHRYIELYEQVVRQNGADPCIGPRLPELFRRAGLQGIRLDVVQPTFLEGEGKRLAATTMQQIETAVVAAGLASAAEVAQVVARLEEFAADPTTLLGMPRIFQVWANTAA
jgi:2-polyprenyl-3-methyl-5-hydroxy-6-metoxy-1,4-benzoquinol methylase